MHAQVYVYVNMIEHLVGPIAEIRACTGNLTATPHACRWRPKRSGGATVTYSPGTSAGGAIRGHHEASVALHAPGVDHSPATVRSTDAIRGALAHQTGAHQ